MLFSRITNIIDILVTYGLILRILLIFYHYKYMYFKYLAIFVPCMWVYKIYIFKFSFLLFN